MSVLFFLGVICTIQNVEQIVQTFGRSNSEAIPEFS